MPVVYIFFAAVHRSRCHVASTTPKFDMVAAFMTALWKKSKSSAKLFSSSRHSCLTGLSTTKCVMSLIVCVLSILSTIKCVMSLIVCLLSMLSTTKCVMSLIVCVLSMFLFMWFLVL